MWSPLESINLKAYVLQVPISEVETENDILASRIFMLLTSSLCSLDEHGLSWWI